MRIVAVVIMLAGLTVLTACTASASRAGCSRLSIQSLYAEAASLDHGLASAPNNAKSLLPELNALWRSNVDCSNHPKLSADDHGTYANVLLIANADGTLIEYALENDRAARKYADRFMSLATALEYTAPNGRWKTTISYARSMRPLIEKYTRMLDSKGFHEQPIDQSKLFALKQTP